MAEKLMSETAMYDFIGILLGFALLKYLPALPFASIAKYSQIIYGVGVILIGRFLGHDGIKRMAFLAGLVEIAGNVFALF